MQERHIGEVNIYQTEVLLNKSFDEWRNQFGHNWFRACALILYYQEIVSLSVG